MVLCEQHVCAQHHVRKQQASAPTIHTNGAHMIDHCLHKWGCMCALSCQFQTAHGPVVGHSLGVGDPQSGGPWYSAKYSLETLS